MATSDQRLSEFEQAQKRYQDLIGGQGAFKSLVEQKLGEKTNYNKDLITQQQNLQERQLSTPSALRAEFATGPIRNPLTQEALVQNRQSNVGSQLGAVNALLSARGQDQANILSTANENYQSQLAAQQDAKNTLYQLYQDALAQEEAARAAAARQSYYDSLLSGGSTTDNTGTEVAIETDEDNRSTGTKALDIVGGASSGLGKTLASTPIIGNVYKSALRKFATSNLGKNMVQGFLNLAKTPLGGKFISQTNIPELQALKKIQTKVKK